MNKVILMGRLTRDPEVRYSQGERSMAIARYTLAVDRRGVKKEGEVNSDFINIVAFDKAGEFAEKFFRKGMRVLVVGRIQTGNYTNKDGQKVNTTDIVAEEQEFADGKMESAAPAVNNKSNSANKNAKPASKNNASNDTFMNIPDGVEDEALPF